MALDPQIKPIVDAVNAAAENAPPDPSVADRRQGYLALSGFAGKGPDLDDVHDSTIPGPAGDVPVRIYRNDGAAGIIVFAHGGGFCIGDLDTHDEVCRQLAAQSGATVLAVHYRLAPEDPFPAAVDDCWAAVQYADAHRAVAPAAARPGPMQLARRGLHEVLARVRDRVHAEVRAFHQVRGQDALLLRR